MIPNLLVNVHQGVTSDEPLYNAVHADFPEIILLRHWQPGGSP